MFEEKNNFFFHKKSLLSHPVSTDFQTKFSNDNPNVVVCFLTNEAYNKIDRNDKSNSGANFSEKFFFS